VPLGSSIIKIAFLLAKRVAVRVGFKFQYADIKGLGHGVRTSSSQNPSVGVSRARDPRSPSPPPSPICRGSGMAVPLHPRFAGDRGSIPTVPVTAIPDLPESGIQLSTIEYCKELEFRLPQSGSGQVYYSAEV
jgi:hypothetical protein